MVNLIVEEVDALHAELVEKVAPIDTGPVDQTWGTREMLGGGDGARGFWFHATPTDRAPTNRLLHGAE